MIGEQTQHKSVDNTMSSASTQLRRSSLKDARHIAWSTMMIKAAGEPLQAMVKANESRVDCMASTRPLGDRHIRVL